MSTTPLLYSILLVFTLNAHAGPTVPGQTEALTTIKEIENLLGELEKGAPACSGAFLKSKCPTVEPQSVKHSFLDPEKAYINKIEAEIKGLKTDASTASKAVPENLKGSNIDVGALKGVVAEIQPRITELNQAKATASKLVKDVDAKLNFYHAPDSKVKSNSFACAKQVSSMATESSVLGFCGQLNTKFDGLACVFKKPGQLQVMYTGEGGNCNPAVETAFRNYANDKLKKLKSNLVTLESYLKETVAKLEKQKGELEAQIAKAGESKQEQPKEDKKPEIAKTEPKKPETAKTEKKDNGGDVAQTKPADNKPAAKPADAPKANTAKPAEPKEPNVAQTPKPSTTSEAPPPPSKPGTTNGMAEDVLADTYTIQPTKPIPPVQLLDDAPQRGSPDYREPATADTGFGPDDSDPSGGSDNGSLGNVTPATGPSNRNTYQESTFFKSRDLDLYSSKDTTYIQKALNQVNGSNLKVDGKYGNNTEAALNAVMQDPQKKAAFAAALRNLMK